MRLAELLAPRFTVFNYDRRGQGDSTDTLLYAVNREFDDLAAVLAVAGGSAALIGHSGTGNIALESAARGLQISKLALWEPPFMVVLQKWGCSGKLNFISRTAEEFLS